MTLKRLFIFAAVALLLAGMWLVATDSDVVRSCEHRGGSVVEAGGVVTCAFAQK